MIPHKTLSRVGDIQLGMVSPKEMRPFNHHMATEKKNSATKSFCVAVLCLRKSVTAPDAGHEPRLKKGGLWGENKADRC